MTLPNRLNLVDIVIEQRDVAATPIDPDFDEPIINVVPATPITLQGQVNLGFKHNELLARVRAGDGNRSSGHVLFRKSDLDAAGVALKKGDRITQIAGVAFKLRIKEARPESPLNGEFLLIYCPFEEDKEVTGKV